MEISVAEAAADILAAESTAQAATTPAAVMVYSADGRCATRLVGPFPNLHAAGEWARSGDGAQGRGYQLWELISPVTPLPPIPGQSDADG